MDAAEALIDADAIAWLDGIAREAITPGRLAAAADVAAAVLTPCAVRRRRAKRPGTPDSEYAASATRGARWGMEAHMNGSREARRRNSGSHQGDGSGGGSAPASPVATLDTPPGPPPVGGAGGGSPTSTLDALPQCAVDQLMAALKHFWTRERINGWVHRLCGGSVWGSEPVPQGGGSSLLSFASHSVPPP